MSEIRCPMCGKPNPPDLEVCQFCGARLVPLVSKTPPQKQPASSPQESAPEEAFIHPEEGAPDWLSDLRPEGSEEDLPAGAEEEELDLPQQPSFDSEESSDWLSRLGEQYESSPGTGSPDSLPDADRSAAHQASAEEETPDWLSGLRPEEQEVSEGQWEAQGESDSEADESNWLPRIQGEEQPVLQDSEEEKEDEGVEEEAVLPTHFGADEPFSEFEKDLDWLGAPEQEAGSENEPQELPDWLRQAAPFEEEPEPEPAAEGELPDWLAQLSEEPPSGSEAPPDWLTEVAPEEEEAEPEPAAAQEELPDWLAESSEEASQKTEAPLDWPNEPEQTESEPLPEPATGEEGQAIPEWLSSEEPESLKHLVEDVEQGELQAAEMAPSEPAQEEDLSGILSEELSVDWLSPEPAEEEQGEIEEAEPELAQAEIPSWLEAMRPIEDAAPSIPVEEEDEERVESAGPLAGLSGVLSAEAEVSKVQKPPTYSVKLQVSESQRARVDVLRNMLAAEGKPQPISRPAVISSQHILRWAIALVLILAVLWPVITGSREAPLPTFSPGTAALDQLINQLPSQARVLLSFDYEPALSGEMDAAASAVVDHLMLRGAYLTLVSTSPTGPIVAERFLSVTQSEHNYASDEQYVNLGYIPGGAAGLLSFAESPQRILPYSLDGAAAWEGKNRQALPPLQGIERLSDFALIMVITANPTVARTWVEQVQPYLDGEASPTPLVMVLSAQAGPLVQPYYQANPRQIQGLVTGLRDGAAYARLTGRSGLPRKYWDAFSVGLLVAGVLITIGGLANIALVVLARLRKSEG
jgi:hypothetical protein